MNRKAINAWLEMQERNVFFRGMTAWLGFTTVRIPFEVARRSAGKSSWSYLKRLRLAVTGLTAFSSFPLQLVTLAGARLLCLCRPFGSADALSETGRPSRERFRDGDSAGTHHRKFADDKPRDRGRIPGPRLRRSKRQTSIRGNPLNRTGYQGVASGIGKCWKPARKAGRGRVRRWMRVPLKRLIKLIDAGARNRLTTLAALGRADNNLSCRSLGSRRKVDKLRPGSFLHRCIP